MVYCGAKMVMVVPKGFCWVLRGPKVSLGVMRGPKGPESGHEGSCGCEKYGVLQRNWRHCKGS